MSQTNEISEGAPASPEILVAPSPHLNQASVTTRRMMYDVLLALLPVVGVAIWVFQWYAVKQIGIGVIACLAAEAAFTAWRGRKITLGDGSAAVTGVILALSLPWSSPWYVGVIAGFVAVGLGKIVFGGLGQNLFNPAMVGRAFVMICFPAALGAAAYTLPGHPLEVLTQATPLTAVKQGLIQAAELMPMLIGNTNGSLGETSALACLLGGLYLCLRRSASWEIPAGTLIAVAAICLVGYLISGAPLLNPLHHLVGGSLLFGAFFIATDPVSSPLTHKGKWIFGLGFGAFVMLIRLASGYPEGVMFAVLLMNSVTPLINRWTIPDPVGGPVPTRN